MFERVNADKNCLFSIFIISILSVILYIDIEIIFILEELMQMKIVSFQFLLCVISYIGIEIIFGKVN